MNPYYSLYRRGSKFPGWLYSTDHLNLVSSQPATISEAAELPELNRRTALKLGAGALTVAAIGTTPRRAEAVGPLLWWLGVVVVEAAIGWVIERTLERYATGYIDAALDMGEQQFTRTAETIRAKPAEVIKPGFPKFKRPALADGKPQPINQLHEETRDPYHIAEAYHTPTAKLVGYNGEKKGYKTNDGKPVLKVDSLLAPIDAKAGMMYVNKKEAEAQGQYGGEYLVPDEVRTQPIDQRVFKTNFKKAVQMYDLDNMSRELTYDDVAYIQKTGDIEGRPTLAYYLKEDVAKQANLPGIYF
ncbi:hypothetical protein Pan97_22710 [Bremerella volcania]|uniref:Uncharacterized protein n=1 Tax=Bremerella volcania TaxID=2527984 RepID=A0A518C7R8_9BACT|nr:hypothetical protein [Bremerella volcania]QDU75242.1 hypothetical protein Pan97_22710 [Bremerella volcania]